MKRASELASTCRLLSRKKHMMRTQTSVTVAKTTAFSTSANIPKLFSFCETENYLIQIFRFSTTKKFCVLRKLVNQKQQNMEDGKHQMKHPVCSKSALTQCGDDNFFVTND